MNAPAFMDDIEAEAEVNSRFAEAVAYATVLDSRGPAIDRFHALQRQVRDRLGIEYFHGWMPFQGDSEPPT